MEDSRKETTLERTLTILELIGQTSAGLTNAEISHRTGIATSSCSYILQRLEDRGYVIRDYDSGRYQLGLRILSLSEGAVRQAGFRGIAKPILHKLAEATRLSTHIGVIERGRVMIVERAESPEFIKVDVAIGTRMPIHTTSMGKVLMAELPTTEVNKLIEVDQLRKSTPKTIADRTRLLREVALARQRGFSISDEEQFLGVRSVAVPIRDSAKHVYAALAAVGFSAQPTWKDLDGLVEMLKETSRQISVRSSAIARG
jgi:DNA-binding IclR family transcriptional regulator